MISSIRRFFATPVFAVSIVLYQWHLWIDVLGCKILGITQEEVVALIKVAYGDGDEE